METLKSKGLDYLGRVAETLNQEPTPNVNLTAQRELMDLQIKLSIAYLLASIASDVDYIRRRKVP